MGGGWLTQTKTTHIIKPFVDMRWCMWVLVVVAFPTTYLGTPISGRSYVRILYAYYYSSDYEHEYVCE